MRPQQVPLVHDPPRATVAETARAALGQRTQGEPEVEEPPALRTRSLLQSIAGRIIGRSDGAGSSRDGADASVEGGGHEAIPRLESIAAVPRPFIRDNPVYDEECPYPDDVPYWEDSPICMMVGGSETMSWRQWPSSQLFTGGDPSKIRPFFHAALSYVIDARVCRRLLHFDEFFEEDFKLHLKDHSSALVLFEAEWPGVKDEVAQELTHDHGATDECARIKLALKKLQAIYLRKFDYSVADLLDQFDGLTVINPETQERWSTVTELVSRVTGLVARMAQFDRYNEAVSKTREMTKIVTLLNDFSPIMGTEQGSCPTRALGEIAFDIWQMSDDRNKDKPIWIIEQAEKIYGERERNRKGLAADYWVKPGPGAGAKGAALYPQSARRHAQGSQTVHSEWCA